MWTIILRFQIQEIEIQFEEETDKKHSAKEALMLWCQRKINNYPNAHVKDFSQSWRNGMAFNALIHSHRPELIDYKNLKPENSIYNLNNAFTVAKDHLAIQPLLDPEDVDVPKPDEKSILTYVSSYYHTFAKYNSEIKIGKRITNIISQLMEIDRLQMEYEALTSKLLQWILLKINLLNNRSFPNDLPEIKQECLNFKEYLTIEKPVKYRNKVDIEALLFEIQTKRKGLGQTSYIPPEGIVVQDIHRNWIALEKAEHQRESALQKKIMFLEKLYDLADIFERKSDIRQNYLEEMIQVLSDGRYGNNLVQVEATIKKHEAISADILSRSERIDSLAQIVKELKEGKFSKIKSVEKKLEKITFLWQKLLSLLEVHRKNLFLAANFMRTKSEIETITGELNEMIKRINIEKNITHLRVAEKNLQSHMLQEAQIASQSETIKRVTAAAENLLRDEDVKKSIILKNEISSLENCLTVLNSTSVSLNQNAIAKREKIIKLRDFYRLLNDIEEEEATLVEKLNICQTILPGKDLLGVISLQQKHCVFEAEVNAYETRMKAIEKKVKNFIDKSTLEHQLIEEKLNSLQSIWKKLQEMTASKAKELSIIIEAFQYHADANETESWLKEKMQLARSEDQGSDEQSALSLLQRHSFLESEVQAYSQEIERLDSQSKKMVNSDVESLFLLSNHLYVTDENDLTEESEIQYKLNQNSDHSNFYENVEVSQVYVLYNYKDKKYSVKKGEILILLEKTTPEWWKTCRENCQLPMFVPSNYVKEIEPKIKQVLSAQKNHQSRDSFHKIKRSPSKKRLSIVSKADTAEQRRILINANYQQLVELCKARRKILEDSIQMFKFNRECDSFENWLNIIEESINNSIKTNRDKTDSKKSIDNMSKNYEKIITDLLAHRTRLNEINKMVEGMNSTHYFPSIVKRREAIQKKWEQINFLQKQLGKNIEGLTSVEVFDEACDETLERINDKIEKIENYSTSNSDLKTVKALQKRHENLERELVPIDDSIKKLVIISENVKSSFPLEKIRVEKRLNELNNQWKKLRDNSVEKRDWLDRIIGLQIIENSSNELMVWFDNYAKPILKYDHEDKSLTTAEEIETVIKEHNDLLASIKDKFNDIKDLQNLSKKLENQGSIEEFKNLDHIEKKYQDVLDDWQKKSQFLKQCYEFNVFNQEADRIDALITSDLNFLEQAEIGKSSHDILSSIKSHETFLSRLNAQDQRFYNLIDFGDKIIQNKYYNSKLIEEKCENLIQRKKLLKEKALQRMKLLNDTRIYYKIKNDIEEFINWAEFKQRLIEELIEDGNNLKNSSVFNRKIKKHQALAAEIKANKTQLDKILSDLQDFNQNYHLDSKELEGSEQKLRNVWEKLDKNLSKNNDEFQKISSEMERKKIISSFHNQIEEIEKAILIDEAKIDQRTCRNLMQQNKKIEQDLFALEKKIKESRKDFLCESDSNENSDFNQLQERLNALKQPLDGRKEKFQLYDRYHQLLIDIETEMQWITERISLVSSKDLPQNLMETQNRIKKIDQNLRREIENRKPYYEKILDNAAELSKLNSSFKDNIQKQTTNLEKNWNNLSDLIANCVSRLHIHLKINQFLSDCSEIESWMNDKINQLNSPVYGKDEFTLIKLLQKQKSIDLEIDTYSGLLEELLHQSEKLTEIAENKMVDKKILGTRAQELKSNLKKLQNLALKRNSNLINLKRFHECRRDCDEFLEWIARQKQTLMNEDLGKDYEHCINLQTKFFDQKRLILANEERYEQCLDNSKRFEESDDNKLIIDIQTISSAWQELINLINIKEHKFIAAMELHRFNRDIADIYERISAKYAALNNDDFGRDCQSTRTLMRNHEIFEKSLLALEAHLKVLIDDSIKLSTAHKEFNPERIHERLNSLLECWEKLKVLSASRKQRLSETYDFFEFVSKIRDLSQWISDCSQEMHDESNSTDTVDQCHNAVILHERIRSEIDSHENEFNTLIQKQNEFENNPFYGEIKLQTERLLQIRDRLYQSWKEKNVLLNQRLNFSAFMRDVKLIQQQCNQFKNRLSTLATTNTVEDATKNLQKFEDFVKIFESTLIKMNSVENRGTELVKIENIYSSDIKSKLHDLNKQRQECSKLITDKKDKLSDDLIYAQFEQDVLESKHWIKEKQLQIEKERQSLMQNDDIDKVEVDIESKLKKLQKHQALEAEIDSNISKIIDIQNKSKHLISKNHVNSNQIHHDQEELLKEFTNLNESLKIVYKGLEEARDIYEFEKNIEQIEIWIRDKELMIQFNDMGEDYEHCQSLLRKLDDVGTDMKVDEKKITSINELAEKLVKKSQNVNIENKLLALNEKWKQLRLKISEHRNRLIDALEIHSLNRELDDIKERISEKHSLVIKDCDAKDLDSIRNIERKHETICLDITAIQQQFKAFIEKDFKNIESVLGTKNAELLNKSQSKINKIEENLSKLNEECSLKSQKLMLLMKTHKFFHLFKEYEKWSEKMLTDRLTKNSNSENVSQAKNELKDHECLKAELVSKCETNERIKNEGLELLNELKNTQNQSNIEKITSCIAKSEELQKSMEHEWQNKNDYLKQIEQLHKFIDNWKLSDSWLTSKEAFLTNEDLGINLKAVDKLIKKNDLFLKSLENQQRINEFLKFSNELVHSKHFDSQNIQIKINEILSRRDRLLQMAETHQCKLRDSKSYWNFMRNLNEIQKWLVEKHKVADDDSYMDSINLLSKKQKHSAFESEIISSRSRVDDILNEGENLIAHSHYRSKEIKDHLDDLKKQSKLLDEKIQFKKQHLNDAYQALQFFRLCDSLQLWIKDVENAINNRENCKDLANVRNLLKKLALLETDVQSHAENVNEIKNKMSEFEANKHFQIIEIIDKGKETIKSFSAIREPISRKKEILEEHLIFFQFKNDVEHEFFWINEKENQLKQFDNIAAIGVFEIQSLIKRLKIIESEIQAHETHLINLISEGHNLLKKDNPDYEQIKRLNDELQEKTLYIKNAFTSKRLFLTNLLELQQYFLDITEAESWIDEKLGVINHEKVIKSEESVLMILKRLDSILSEAEQFKNTNLAKIDTQSQQLIAKNHHESEIIAEKFDDLELKFDSLMRSIEQKKDLMVNKGKHFRFEREVDDLIMWIKDQKLIADSEDYGQDVEHVEDLIHQFNTFASQISKNENRVQSILDESLEHHDLKNKVEEIGTLWKNLKNSMDSREETLLNALEVHRYYQNAEETISWIREKESSAVLDNIDPNIDENDSITIKIHQLKGFEQDLNALREQVEKLLAEADRLSITFDQIEDIRTRKSEVQTMWDNLNKKTEFHKQNLIQIQSIQSYFDKYHELLTWVTETQALITSDDKLLESVIAAEQQLNRHKDYEIDINNRNDSIIEFINTGEEIISQGHLMSKEIKDRNERIKNLYKNLRKTWQKRLKIYEYNLDARQFLQDVSRMEKWIQSNHRYIDDVNFGDSISEVEELLLKHSEFENTIETQMKKLGDIERITLIEQYFENLKREEENLKSQELLRRQKEELIAEEQKRILHQRLTEDSNIYENVSKKTSLQKDYPKSPRRIASFAFSRKNNPESNLNTLNKNLPPIAYEGFLDRKQVLQQGGKKAVSRSWKTYYTLLCGHLLCFFKDKNAFYQNSAASPPFSILNAHCVVARDYNKRKNVFSIQLTDMTKYLFHASNENKLRDWINSITFRAILPPSQQLIDSELINRSTPIRQSSMQTNNADSDGSSSSRKSSLCSLTDLNHNNHQNHSSVHLDSTGKNDPSFSSEANLITETNRKLISY